MISETKSVSMASDKDLQSQAEGGLSSDDEVGLSAGDYPIIQETQTKQEGPIELGEKTLFHRVRIQKAAAWGLFQWGRFPTAAGR